MVFHSKVFWGCLGALFCWVFVWSAVTNALKNRQPYSNRYINKLADNIEIVAILPLIPPILVYALFLRLVHDPIRRRFRNQGARREERRQGRALKVVLGAHRRMLATQDLAYVRREKMPLVKDVEVLGPDGEVLNLKSPLETVTSRGQPIQDLPAELRIQIYSLLDYGTALRLARVNRFFYFERPSDSIDQEQRMTYLFHADSFAQNKRRLACYGCLRARSLGDYLVEHRSGEFDRFGEREFERRCFDCIIKTDDIGRTRLWRFKFWRWEMRTFHRAKDTVTDV